MEDKILYDPVGILLSSGVGDVDVSVKGSVAVVKLTAGEEVLLEEQYYAYDNRITLYNIGDLIEDYLRVNNGSYGTFDLTLLGTDGTKKDHVAIEVLYCDRLSYYREIDTFLADNFLTSLSHRRVRPDDSLTLGYFARKGDDISAVVAVHWRCTGGRDANIHFVEVQAGVAGRTGVDGLIIDMAGIVRDMAEQFQFNARKIEVVCYTVVMGQRSVTLYVDREPPRAETFIFRNMFNVDEVAAFPATVTAKTAVEGATAVVNGRMLFYDQSTAKSYEVQTGPLTSDEAEWVEQFLTSRRVWRLEYNGEEDADPYTLAPVLVTDSEAEIGNDDEKTNSIKFTWRYANTRPVVRLRETAGIFSREYNLQFS